MPHYPAARLLVPPAPPNLPDGFTTLQSSVVNGLPHIVDLPNNTRLTVTLPTGLLPHWLDADPADLVATSDDEEAPRPAELPEQTDTAARPALRLSARQSGRALGTMSFSLQATRLLRDDGDAAAGAAIEVVLLGWALHAGTVRGHGDFGSSISLGWRRANLAVEIFGPPVINPFLVHRLPLIFRIYSELGLRRRLIDNKFVVRRQALHEFI
jgi:hypothetical protein